MFLRLGEIFFPNSVSCKLGVFSHSEKVPEQVGAAQIRTAQGSQAGSQEGRKAPSKVPKRFPSKVPRNSFSSKVARKMFSSKVPRKRFASRGSQLLLEILLVNQLFLGTLA